MTARSANGSCTPTEFSSGGSANATGVMVTLVMRMLPALIAGSALVGFRQGREAGREDARQLLPVRLRQVGEGGAAPAGGVSDQLDARLDERDGVAGALRPQPGERVVEGPLK